MSSGGEYWKITMRYIWAGSIFLAGCWPFITDPVPYQTSTTPSDTGSEGDTDTDADADADTDTDSDSDSDTDTDTDSDTDTDADPEYPTGSFVVDWPVMTLGTDPVYGEIGERTILLVDIWAGAITLSFYVFWLDPDTRETLCTSLAEGGGTLYTDDSLSFAKSTFHVALLLESSDECGLWDGNQQTFLALGDVQSAADIVTAESWNDWSEADFYEQQESSEASWSDFYETDVTETGYFAWLIGNTDGAGDGDWIETGFVLEIE